VHSNMPMALPRQACPTCQSSRQPTTTPTNAYCPLGARSATRASRTDRRAGVSQTAGSRTRTERRVDPRSHERKIRRYALPHSALGARGAVAHGPRPSAPSLGGSVSGTSQAPDVAANVKMRHGLGAGSPTHLRIGRLLTCTLSGRYGLEPATSAPARRSSRLPRTRHEDLDRERTSDEPRHRSRSRSATENDSDQPIRVGAEGLEPPASAL
jgi:hypothetical protein